MPVRRAMPVVLQWIWVCGVFIVACVGLTALANWWLNDDMPLWIGAVKGAVLGVGTHLMLYAERRGWLKNGLWTYEKHDQRRQQLAAEREQILAEANAKPPKP